MEKKKSLPMGMENFERIQNEDFYYIDKTGLIKDLLENKSYVTLFTRPRRFGKTLTMSMLKYFFEIGSDSTLFDGLEIAKEKRLCDEYRGKFPVISEQRRLGLKAFCKRIVYRKQTINSINN